MTLEETRATWDAEAATFDDEPDHGLGDPATREAWRCLLLQHLPRAPARIADLGCGTGSLSVLLAEEGHSVRGVDLAPEMVARARAKAAAANLPATFEVGDVSQPALPAGQFDVVLSRHVLWALPDPAAGLRRWIDLLSPSGRLVLVEGRWCTGAGLAAAETEALVRETGRGAVVHHLREPAYWGREIDDERYLLVSAG